MNSLQQTIEALLFISAHPMSVQRLAEVLKAPVEEVHAAADALVEDYRTRTNGIQVNRIGKSYQMATTSSTSEVVQAFLKEEEKKELTKPSLETLTIIAYRGPISKAELELIRGVNCSLILRNLLIRGLVEEVPTANTMTTSYQVTFDFLHYLGIRETKELPDFTTLNASEHLASVLKQKQEEPIAADALAQELPGGEKPKAETEATDDDDDDKDDDDDDDDDV